MGGQDSLFETTFVVVDLETTGCSPMVDSITEIGIVVLRGGETVKRVQTLVRPEQPIPPSITSFTGITNEMLVDAPAINSVIGIIAELLEEGVVVGHNVRFDLSFLNVAFSNAGLYPHDEAFLDTCLLARRLNRGDVINHKLGTLAMHFDLDRQPTHRAFDDAVATGELLHRLLEHAGTFGIETLGALLAFQSAEGLKQVRSLEKKSMLGA